MKTEKNKIAESDFSKKDFLIPFENLSPSAKMSFRHLHPELITREALGEKQKPKESLPTEVKPTRKIDNLLFERIKKIIIKYIDTKIQNVDIFTLWIIGTYFHNQFETFPLLQIYAQKRTGKTRSLKLLSSLACKSDGSINTSPTETLLFRHKEGALFFDEMENISSKERSAFRETLNAVYKKGNKIIRYREVKTKDRANYEEQSFYPYYPIALANIHGLNDILEDRAIQVILQRSKKKQTKLVEDFSTNPEILSIREELKKVNPEIPKNFFSEWNDFIEGLGVRDKSLLPMFQKIKESNIYGRSLEIFFPLFVIADLCDNLDDFLETAKDYIKRREEEELADDYDELLKQFINESSYKGFVGLMILLKHFKFVLENPEDWINSKWLGRALKRLGLINKKRRVNGKVEVILNKTPETKELEEETNSSSINSVSSVCSVCGSQDALEENNPNCNTINTINNINTTNTINTTKLSSNTEKNELNECNEPCPQAPPKGADNYINESAWQLKRKKLELKGDTEARKGHSQFPAESKDEISEVPL